MFCTQNVTKDIFYIGGSDRRLALFENAFPVPNGISYNAYWIADEKTAVIDTVDKSVSTLFLENLAQALQGRPLDYIVINHMEPDHCATLGELCTRYPTAQIVCNQKTVTLIQQFFDLDLDTRCHLVQEGDTLVLGRHTLSFHMAPMVHWPEVMVTYDKTDKVLFSADAFGTFGALHGNLFAENTPFETEGLSEFRRYYANIVGKYGVQTLALLQKLTALEVDLICPLHGPIHRTNIDLLLQKYRQWGAYEPESRAVLIAYASIYGGTQNAAEILAAKLAQRGVRDIVLRDVSVTHPSYLVAEAFRCSHLVFAASTYNNEIFPAMETLLLDLKAHALRNRTVGIVENGSWAPQSGKRMHALLSAMPGMTILDERVALRSTVKAENLLEIDALAQAIATSL